MDLLSDVNYLDDKIIAPALAYSKERALITALEERVLQIAAKKGIAKAVDLAVAMPAMSSTQRTYQIKKLVERKMLQPINEGARQYTIGFSNNHLMRGIIRALSDESFIPATLNPTA